MALKIHNTLTGNKETFQPQRPGEAGMYVCGVTVYDECHLGHARAYVSFDVIKRYLEFSGYRVRYVRNVTDVDDKIIDKAAKEGRGVQDVAEQYYKEFAAQMKALQLQEPHIEPRATQHIPEMQDLIRKLIAKGVAYQAGGDVYFEVGKFPSYGGLSRRTLDEMVAGARVEVNEQKRNPLDFVLWKAAKPGEPFWESPWGNGRPGWHIECSAMSMKYLGETFDLHGGGQDLIFPHHENEIAQSSAATGKPLARCWVHNGFVMFKSHKMSKSLGNVFTLSKLFAQFPAPVVKFFLLTKHYRSPVDFALPELEEAKKNLEKIDNTLGMVRQRLDASGISCAPGSAVPAEFREAMDDDFNTPRALAVVHEVLGKLHTQLREGADGKALGGCLGELVVMLDVLGVPYRAFVLDKVSKEKQLSPQEEEALLAKDSPAEADIVSLIEARNFARKTKDFARADRVRKGLAAKGIILRDEPGGATTWVKASEKAN